MLVTPHSLRKIHDYVSRCPFYIGNERIEKVESFLHVSRVVTSQRNDDDDIYARRRQFMGQVNNMFCFFNKLNSFSRYSLFTSYCSSLYGSELCLLTNNHLDQFSVSWRKSLRATWRLSS